MPDWASLFAGSPGMMELAQYPDAHVYKSIGLLRPEERPRVPVRMTDDPIKTYGEYGIPRSKLNLPAAFIAPTRDAIYVNRKHEVYKKPQNLAATLAHEAYHLQNDKTGMSSGNENAARGREIEVLQRFGPRYRELIEHLRNANSLK